MNAVPCGATRCTDLTKAFFIVTMSHSFTAHKEMEFHWCVWKKYGVPRVDFHETRTRLAATRAGML